jgi:hypothetical protein
MDLIRSVPSVSPPGALNETFVGADTQSRTLGGRLLASVVCWPLVFFTRSLAMHGFRQWSSLEQQSEAIREHLAKREPEHLEMPGGAELEANLSTVQREIAALHLSEVELRYNEPTDPP